MVCAVRNYFQSRSIVLLENQFGKSRTYVRNLGNNYGHINANLIANGRASCLENNVSSWLQWFACKQCIDGFQIRFNARSVTGEPRKALVRFARSLQIRS